MEGVINIVILELVTLRNIAIYLATILIQQIVSDKKKKKKKVICLLKFHTVRNNHDCYGK